LDAQPDPRLNPIRGSFEELKKQSYSNWTAVYFVDKVTEEMKEYVSQQNQEA